jgi:hypothetical protein
LRLPTLKEPRHGSSRWEIVRFAMTSNPRAARFCVIWLVTTGVPVVIVTWLVTTGVPATTVFELLRHIQLHAHVLSPAVRAAGGHERLQGPHSTARQPTRPG